MPPSFSESSKPAQICTYLHERPRKTKTNMYKFAPHALVCELRTGTNLHKFAPPRGSGGPTGGGGCKFGWVWSPLTCLLLLFLLLKEVVRSNTFLEHFCLDQFSVFRAKFTFKGSRTPCLGEHFWVPVLWVACSKKLFDRHFAALQECREEQEEDPVFGQNGVDLSFSPSFAC